MLANDYTSVVAVRCHKATPNAMNKYIVCRVPDGAVLDRSDMVFYTSSDSAVHQKGVCVSDVLFLNSKTVEMLCTVTNTAYPPPVIAGKISVDWYNNVTEPEPTIEEVCD